jgi:hypothetical protein
MTTPSGLPITGNPATYAGVDNPATPQREDHTSRFAGLIGNLVKYAQGQGEQNPTVQKGLDEYGRIAGQVQEVRNATALGRGALLTSGMTSPVAQGRAAVVAQTGAAQEAALGSQQQAALQSAQVGIQGQQATTGALASAAGITAPQLGQYGQAYYDPVTGQQTGEGSQAALNPVANIKSIAQQVVNGQISPSQGYQMGGSVANFQGALNQAILAINPGFNIANAQGQFDARQQNTTTSGTIGTTTAASTYAQNYPAFLQLQNTVQNVDQFGNLLIQTMRDGGINPFDVKYSNTALANIRAQLSSSQQAQFDNTYASLKSRVSGLLAQGGSEIPSQITADANKILDGSLPLSALNAVLQRISTEGQILLSNQAQLVNVPGSAVGAPKVGGNNNPLGI